MLKSVKTAKKIRLKRGNYYAIRSNLLKKKKKLEIYLNNIVTKFQPYLNLIHWDFDIFTIIFEKIMKFKLDKKKLNKFSHYPVIK